MSKIFYNYFIITLSFITISYSYLRQYFTVPQELLFIITLYFPFLCARILKWNSKFYKRQFYILTFAVLFLTIIFSSGFNNIPEVFSLFLCLLSFFVGSSLNEKNLNTLVYCIFIFSGIASFFIFFNSYMGIKIFNIDFRFQYLPSSFVQAIFTLGCFSLSIFGKRKFLFKIMFLLALYFQFLNFGRGSILLGIIIIMMDYIIINYYNKKYLKITLIIFSLLLIFNVVFQFLLSSGLLNYRLLRLFSDVTEEPRLEVWSRVFDYDFNVFIGGGMGFYNTIHSTHPHNSILQLFEDSGIFGSLIYLFLLFASFKRYLIKITSEHYRFVNLFMFSIFLLYLITSQFSGNLYYNYGFFLLIGCGFSKYVNNNVIYK